MGLLPRWSGSTCCCFLCPSPVVLTCSYLQASDIVSVWTNHGSSHPRIRRRSGFQDRTLELKELDSRGQTQSMISDAQGAAPLQEATSSREVSAMTVVTWGPAGLARTPTFLLVFNVCGVCVSTGFLGLRMTASIS